MGCRPNGLNPFIVSDIYKTFSQSILLYGLEVLNYSATAINEVNIRQNILIKNTIGLSKFVKTTPLFTALRIKSIKHLLWEHKISFVVQLCKVDYTKKIYEYLNDYYKYQPMPTDSFFKSLSKIREDLNLCENERRKSIISKKLDVHFNFVNDGYGLIDSIKTILRKIEKYVNNSECIILLSNLLAVMPTQ